MKINRLLKTSFKNNHIVTKITDNSKDCIENCVFVVNKNNFVYLQEAINNGARTFISENKLNLISEFNEFIVENVKVFQAKLLYKFYKKYIDKYTIVGVTGTNGKTTTSTIIYKYLYSIKEDVLLISSNGIYFDGLKFDTNNTTPNIFVIYNYIVKNITKDKYKKNKNKKHYLILECSSQGIRDLRLKYIPFDIVLFTNITSDHMDFHENYSDYFYSKCLLLNYLKQTGKVIINKDSTNHKLIGEISNNDYITFGKTGDIKYKIDELNLYETIFTINNNRYKTSLVGDFNIENIVAAYTVLMTLNINLNNFNSFIENISPTEGRINIYKFEKHNIIIDYAHTYEGVRRIISFIKDHISSNLIVVIGCGGNRDKTKRSLIGKFVTENSNNVVFTEDNNREESFESIINDITKDISNKNYKIIQSRFQSIKYVLENFTNHCILIIGKGIETTNVSGDFLTDIEMVRKILNA